MARDESITVLIDAETKKAYWKWCIDNGLPMGELLRDFVRWIVQAGMDAPTIRAKLADLQRKAEGEKGEG